MFRIEVAGDICLRRPRTTQGCRAAAAADDDDVYEATVATCSIAFMFGFGR